MENFIKKNREELINIINNYVDSNFLNNTLHDAMRYALLPVGSLWRPILHVLISSSLGVYDLGKSANVIIAMEMIHAYSLIHDDLPCMDNDDYRRGKPSCHKQFSEGVALLAGDSLLTLAFEVCSYDVNSKNAVERIRLINSLARAVGYKGLVLGQEKDIVSGDDSISQERLLEINSLKTGCLFGFACESVGILYSMDDTSCEALRYFGQKLGVSYQDYDNIIDGDVAVNYGDKKSAVVGIRDELKDFCKENFDKRLSNGLGEFIDYMFKLDIFDN